MIYYGPFNEDRDRVPVQHLLAYGPMSIYRRRTGDSKFISVMLALSTWRPSRRPISRQSLAGVMKNRRTEWRSRRRATSPLTPGCRAQQVFSPAARGIRRHPEHLRLARECHKRAHPRGESLCHGPPNYCLYLRCERCSLGMGNHGAGPVGSSSHRLR
mgnify:CR=1 FL=1